MEKIRIGVLCPSEIAFRRFVPSLLMCENFTYMGVAVADKTEWDGDVSEDIIKSETDKAERFKSEYGGKVYKSYTELISDPEIDAVYLPLPPALHYRWGKSVLEKGKHLFMEKPFTVSEELSQELISLAEKNNVAVHENYMFLYHSQLEYIKSEMKEIGEIRSIRGAFTFPMRAANDFRYKKELGGGALLDCGGYPVRLISELLGDDIRLDTSRMQFIDGYEVDFYGSATLSDKNTTAQIIYGMDNSYKCELEIQGSKGCIYTDRIFTAPDGYVPTVWITKGNEKNTVTLEPDNSFKKSIDVFYESVINKDNRKKICSDIIKQAKMIDAVKSRG